MARKRSRVNWPSRASRLFEKAWRVIQPQSDVRARIAIAIQLWVKSENERVAYITSHKHEYWLSTCSCSRSCNDYAGRRQPSLLRGDKRGVSLPKTLENYPIRLWKRSRTPVQTRQEADASLCLVIIGSFKRRSLRRPFSTLRVFIVRDWREHSCRRFRRIREPRQWTRSTPTTTTWRLLERYVSIICLQWISNGFSFTI